jgi:uncharacterized protein
MALSLRTFLERPRSAPLAKAEPDWLERGAAAHEKQEYLTALKAWKIAGAQGDVEAQYHIGLLYARGEGVVQSVPDAVIWYRQAAEAGHIDAQYQLGLIYLNGAVPGPLGPGTWFQAASQHNSEAAARALKVLFPNGIAVEKDLKEAMRWMGAAAAGGKVDAQAVVGEMYRRGLGCTQDYAEAARWCWLAAEQGVASAQFAMGDIYYQALGVEVDHQAAAAWYEKAAKNGDARAQVALAFMCSAGEGKPTDLDEAGRLFVQAAEQGEARGLYHAALMHLKGEGLPENIDRAETYLRKSAKQNYLPAITKLAEFYAHGRGIEPDLREAATWHSRAAELGDVQSQFIIGRLYATGTGVPINLRESARWFLRAAEQGHATAAHNVAVYYANGTGVERDLVRAIDWYSKAAEGGITASQVQLGKLYCAGEGVPRDLEKATLWLRKAVESGDPEAKTALAMLHLQGEEGARDTSRAEELLKQAAEGGHAAAATQLGHLYFGKYTIETKAGDAVRWYTKAAEAGNIEAQHTLGMLYLNGRGVAKNLPAAANWIEKAARGDHAPSQFQLAVMFCTAQGVPRDLGQAVSWYEQAAQRGHPLAQYNLAVMLSKGQGCEANEARAASWFQKAADQGLAEAKRALVDLFRAGRLPPSGDEVAVRSLDQGASAESTGLHTTDPREANQPQTIPSSETNLNSNEVDHFGDRTAQAQADLSEPLERRTAPRPGALKPRTVQHGRNLSPASSHRDRDQRDHRTDGRVPNLALTHELSNATASATGIPSDLQAAAQSTRDRVPSSPANVAALPRVPGDKSHLGLPPAPDETVARLKGQQTSLDSPTDDPSASRVAPAKREQDELSASAPISRSPSGSELAGHARIASARVAFPSDRRSHASTVAPNATEGIEQTMARPGPALRSERPQRPHSDASPLTVMGRAPSSFDSTGSLEQRVRHIQGERLPASRDDDAISGVDLPAQRHADSRASRPSGADLPERQSVAHQADGISSSELAATLAESVTDAGDTPRLREALQALFQLRPQLFSTGNHSRPATSKPPPHEPHDMSVESAPNGHVGAQPPPLSALPDTSDSQAPAEQSESATPTRPGRDASTCDPKTHTVSERGNRSRSLAHIDSDATSLTNRDVANAIGERRECVRKRSDPADHSRAASILGQETPKDTAELKVEFGDASRESDASTPRTAKFQTRRWLVSGNSRGNSSAGTGRASADIKFSSASEPNQTILKRTLRSARLSPPSNARLHREVRPDTSPHRQSHDHTLSQDPTNLSPSISPKRRFIMLAVGAGTAAIVWASVLAIQTPIPPLGNLVRTDSLDTSNVVRREINNTDDGVKVDSDTRMKLKTTNFLSKNGNDIPLSLDQPSDLRGGSTELPPAIEAKPIETPVDSVSRTETGFNSTTLGNVHPLSDDDQVSRPEPHPLIQGEINQSNDRVKVESDRGAKSKNTNFLSTNGNDARRSVDRRSEQRGGSTEILPTIEAKSSRTPVDSVNSSETRFNLRTAADVQEVQRRLVELGYLPFLADGVWGPHSIQALRSFRMSAGLGSGDQWDRKTEDILFAVTAPRATAPVASPLQLPPG